MIFQKGFTFIELLVVVSIVGVLTAIGLANFQTINKLARDGKRKSDFEQIRAALEAFRSDNGAYPAVGSINGRLKSKPCNSTLVNSGGTVTYMDPVPCDPKNTGSYRYTYTRPTSLTYTLVVEMEIDTSGGTCGSGTSYCVKQP